MAKRKKISKLAKAKKDITSRYWRNKADAVWSKAVRRDGRCLVCGTTESLQAHHLISRWIIPLRHELMNGVCLCPKHHKWDRHISGHQSPFGLAVLILREKPDVWAWLTETFNNWYEIVGAGVGVDYKAAYERLAGLVGLEHA